MINVPTATASFQPQLKEYSQNA